MILEYRSIILWLPGKSVPKNAARLDVAFAPLLDSGLEVELGYSLCADATLLKGLNVMASALAWQPNSNEWPSLV